MAPLGSAFTIFGIVATHPANKEGGKKEEIKGVRSHYVIKKRVRNVCQEGGQPV